MNEKTRVILSGFNSELGRNPLNVSFVNGLGWKQQRETVNQYAQNDTRVLPPSGIPQGNISDKFLEPGGSWPYPQLETLCFPAMPEGKDKHSFGFYERWADTYNIEQEFVSFQSARALATAAYLAAATGNTGSPWRSADANPVIDFPNGNPTLTVPGVTRLTAKVSTVPMDLSSARVVWEVEGQEPRFGQTASVGRSTPGPLHVEAEAVLPDGRRVFASKNVLVNDPNGGSEFTPDGNTIALYHFNSISGNQFLDSSGRGHHLNISGGAMLTDNTAWMQSSPAGANAVRFSNVGDELSVTIPYQEVYPSSGTTLTIDFRIYPRAYKGDGQRIVRLQQIDQTDTQWSVYFPNSWDLPTGVPHRPQVIGPSAVMLASENWDAHVALNTWHHFRIMLDASGTSRLFIDDMVNPVAVSSTAPIFRQINWLVSLGNFDGDVDELQISH